MLFKKKLRQTLCEALNSFADLLKNINSSGDNSDVTASSKWHQVNHFK